MKLTSFLLRNVLVLVFLVAGLATAAESLRPVDALPTAMGQPGEQVSLSGWLAVIWGDGPPGSNAALAPIYMLFDDQGQSTQLLLTDELIRPLGGILALIRQRVTVVGVWTSTAAQTEGRVLHVTSIQLGSGAEAPTAAADVSVIGSQPWVTILCKFSDVATEPKSLSYFQGLLGSTYPELDHYWRELSYHAMNLVGSSATGWYTLPHPKSYYVYDSPPQLNVERAASDCTAVADDDVYFPKYFGINLMFNDQFTAARGGIWGMTRDGVSRLYSMTWMPPWGYETQAVMAHEMGHGFGLGHSSGAYGQTYDNQWDVMSNIGANCSLSSDPVYGCLGQHTISYHKDRLGWIAAGQKYLAKWDSQATITLERLALPQTSNYKMVQIPIGGLDTHFYTVEVRRKVGYDVKLPGEAVIIHEVDRTRMRPAYVVDIDNNGNTGDAGAMWIPGEIFTDTANGITVCVNSATTTGFVVTVGLGVEPQCSFQADLSPSTLQANPVCPAAGEQVTFTTRLINGGTPADGVVVTSAIPNDTTYVPGSATTSQGTVTGDGPLVFDVGTLMYDTPVTLTFDVTVNAGIVSPTVLSGPITITWEGGGLSRTHIAIANCLKVYLPVIYR